MASVEPLALVAAAHRKESRAEIDNGILTVASDLWLLKADAATGRIIEIRYGNEDRYSLVRFGRGEFERLQNEINRQGVSLNELFDKSHPCHSFSSFAIKTALTQPYVQESAVAEVACRRVQKMLEAREDDPFYASLADIFNSSEKSPKPGQAEFEIPQAAYASEGDVGFIATSDIPAMADVMLPRGSWLWTAVREGAFGKADGWKADGPYSKGVTEEVFRVLQVDTGPISMLLISQLFEGTMSPGTGSRMAGHYLKQFDAADIKLDIQLLASGDSGLAHMVRGAVTLCDQLDDDRKLLLENLPEPASEIVKQFISRHALNPKESAEQAITAILTEAWNTKYQELTRIELKRLAGQEENAQNMARTPGSDAVQ